MYISTPTPLHSMHTRAYPSHRRARRVFDGSVALGENVCLRSANGLFTVETGGRRYLRHAHIAPVCNESGATCMSNTSLSTWCDAGAGITRWTCVPQQHGVCSDVPGICYRRCVVTATTASISTRRAPFVRRAVGDAPERRVVQDARDTLYDCQQSVP